MSIDFLCFLSQRYAQPYRTLVFGRLDGGMDLAFPSVLMEMLKNQLNTGKSLSVESADQGPLRPQCVWQL